MPWFKKNTSDREELERKALREVQRHEQKSKVAVENVEKVTADLREVIKRNGFTLQVHAAIRGKH